MAPGSSLRKGATSEWVVWTVGERIVQLAVLIVAGIVIYFATLALLGVRVSHLRHPVSAEAGSADQSS